MTWFLLPFLLFFVLCMSLPAVILSIVLINQHKRNKKISQRLSQYAAQNKWQYMTQSTAFKTHDTWGEFLNISRSYRHVLIGNLYKSKSKFIQYFLMQKNQSVLITRATIKDTKIEVLLTPRYVGFDITKDSVAFGFIKESAHSFEGDFGSMFNVYYSSDEQLDLYTLFGPDVLQYIKDNLSQYSIAINGRYIFIYTKYDDVMIRHDLITLLDGLIEELRLGYKYDAHATTHELARTAKDNSYQGVKKIRMGVGRNFWITLGYSFLVVVLYILSTKWI